MADLYANVAFDIYNLNLKRFDRHFVDFTFQDNANTLLNFKVHQDIYAATLDDGIVDLTLFLAGSGLHVNDKDSVNRGTLTGIMEWDNATDTMVWSLEGISGKAKVAFWAAQTASNDDDFSFMRQVLSGHDNIQLSPEADIMSGFDGHDTILGNGGGDILLGGKGEDIIGGGEGDDRLNGNAHADRLFGEDGEDLLLGSGGDDRLFGGNDNDTLKGGGGNDILSGGSGRDKLIGNGGNDELEGGDGNDILSGGAGNDILNGGPGNDLMKGLTGLDVFVYELGNGADTIKDFEDGLDRIDLTDFLFGDTSAALNFASQVGADVVFDFGDGNTLTILNVLFGKLGGADLEL
jgi:Ca2+-binding RTX toxin-like protein